jgi:hypothetical protein
MADKDLSALLAELGGDNPQNRAIAEGLQKQGVSSVKNIGVKTENRPAGDFIDPDTGERSTYSAPQQVFYDKSTNQDINPTRLGQYDVKSGDKIQGNIFFHLNADDNGNVSFSPQWSPRAHGYLRDNAVGQAIMAIGKILPVTSPYFLAASAADAAAHGNYGAAIANLVPMGIQQLASGTDLLSTLGGEDFNPLSKTPAGNIAEALGVPANVADKVGSMATSAVKAGLSGKDAGDALLKSGIGSLVGDGASYLKGAGADLLNDVKGGITTLFGESATDATEGMDGARSVITQIATPPNAGETDWNYENQTGANTGAAEKDAALPDTRGDENGIGGLDTGAAGTDTTNYSLEGGAGNDYVSPPSDGNTDGTMVDDAGGVATVDGGDGNDTITGGEGNSTIGGGEGNDTFGGGDPGPDEPPIDTTQPLGLPPGAGPDEPEPYTGLDEPPVEEPPVEEPPVEKPLSGANDTGLLPKVPAIFPPKKTTPKLTTVTPKKEPLDGADDTGLGSLAKTLIGGTVVGKTISDLTKTDTSTPAAPALADPLKGNYNFSWNQQQTKAPEKGVAYGQRYFGPHWSQQAAAQAAAQTSAQPSKDTNMPSDQIQFAEGGLMALDKTLESPTFKPTMVDGGIQAGDITKKDVANQALQHLRQGGHLVDHKLHKDVHYLASKGEPVHHIVGFMNHRKRMAKGGITSHSLGSYSDGGHLLKGPGDGMSDDIPATIAEKQPARLANEEFVIPADVVSHLGNGSSESGAKVLYEMMARIRKARTGNPKQGKQIDPHKLLPKV